MKISVPRFVLLAALLLSVPFAARVSAQGVEIGYPEEFALADDREATLEQLIPGTEASYYYRCLLLQHQGRFDEVPPVVTAWVERHGRGTWVRKIESRQALLRYSTDPAATYAFLREQLNPFFGHQRQTRGEKPDLPVRLDPALVLREAFAVRALEKRNGTLQGVNDSALEWMAQRELDGRQLHELLGRLEHPDVPNLPALVVKDMERKSSRGFGSQEIHEHLLLDQLEACAALRPSLLEETEFVDAWLQRLAPNPDVAWRRDVAAREAYLNRLQEFVKRLTPAFNSLKAHVLYHRLAHDLKLGRVDRQLFLSYLTLPRRTGYVHARIAKPKDRDQKLVDFGEDFDTELPSIGSDEALVRTYLMHFFAREEDFGAFTELIQREYLERLFAETKILAGIGDMERWYSLLDDPAYYEQLKERVEIEFAPTQKTECAVDEAVSIAVDLKNVETLLVKVFRINTLNYHVETGREIDASINLDGLVANEENTYPIDENPLRRVRHTFEFPALAEAGVYVVELIGNGLSSRAVIRKGRLQLTSRTGAAGHVVRVFDEEGNHLKDAAVRLGAREYEADDDGEILIPFSTDGGRRSVVIRSGERSAVEEFYHHEETYRLKCTAFLDRESLLSGGTAKILVRPMLTLVTEPVSLSLLEDPVLTVTSVDIEGVPSSLEVRDLELSADGELVHEIQVPPRVTELTVSLRGEVQSLSEGEKKDLSVRAGSFRLNRIEEVEWTCAPLLGRTDQGYVLDVLGKNGEPRAEEAVTVSLRHRDFVDRFDVNLKTDGAGRIELGELEGIDYVQVSGFPDGYGGWPLRPQARNYPHVLRGTTGQTLRVPYLGEAESLTRAIVSLLEKRGDANYRDRFEKLALVDGYLELSGLGVGNYELLLKEVPHDVEVTITAGPVREGWIVGRDRMLPGDEPVAMQILAAEVEGEELVIRLARGGDDARVHLFATRYLPVYSPFGHLVMHSGNWRDELELLHADSTYHSGREIGDEYRYILERRYATKFPGNMLRRPSLLLNPWARDESNGMIGMGGGSGGRYGGKFGGRRNLRAAAGAEAAPTGSSPGVFANLDFLPAPSVLLENLEPDEEGVVRVPLAALGEGQMIHVVATDRMSTIYTSRVRPEKTLVPAEQRLTAPLDSERHFSEQRRLEFVDAGASTVIEDLATASVETFDSLADVHQLLVTLSGNQDLAEFAFLLGWPQLDDERKRALYSKYACHELHFFLHEKDPGFFDAVIRPYLANKAHRTFLDRWLLEEELTSFLDPWAFARLNAVERILLGRRLAGEGDAVRRQLRELQELSPPDPVIVGQLFDTALAGGALERGRGFADEKKVAERQQRSEGKQYRGPGDTGPPGAGGGGGGGPATPGPAGPPAPVSGAPAGTAEAPAEDAFEEEEEILEEPVLADAELKQLEALGYAGGDDDESEKDMDRREQARSQQLYRRLDQTREYVEHNYWHRGIGEQNAALVEVNSFWLDYAAADDTVPFFSTHFPETAGSFAEMLFALAVLDLPFVAADHDVNLDGRQLTLGAKSPLLLVRKELLEATAATEEVPLLIRQNLFRLDDRYLHAGNERRDKFVTDEFLTGVPYGCQVVLTNPDSTPRRLELLLQIPEGAIPVREGFETRGVSVHLDPFATTTFEYCFYFPAPGTFAHYPVHVSREGELVAFVAPLPLRVLREPSRVDTTSWEHVSQQGSAEQVLAFLEAANLQRLDLSRIAWRLRDESFFTTMIDRLRARHVYDSTVWSYALHHEDGAATREYLRHASGLLRQCGSWLDTPLVRIDPIERRAYEHVEYEPLVNGRAHPFGRKREILNHDLARQYLSLLDILSHKPALDAIDWMSVTYYLLLQDRVEEALAMFAKVDPAQLDTALQYDYFRAYLDFFTDDHALARAIAEPYRDHPGARWRALFGDVLAQLDEAEGNGVAVSDEEDRTQRQTALAAAEPQLELEVEARRVTLDYKNLELVTLSYYEMDIEFLFSTSPFVQQDSGSFAYIHPNRRDFLPLEPDETQHRFDLPEEFRSSNVLVEARAGGVVRRQAYYANSLSVQMMENYGQLKVTHAETDGPLAKVYVKVFARLADGSVRFHKDGYTDLRGRFDYTSLSGDGSDGAARYAILILSETDGAVIREVDPPLE